MANSPTDVMKSGAAILSPLLSTYGLQFRVVSEGQSSGGLFCEAEFSDGVRVLELHYRYSLGLIRYHLADHTVSHQAYMETLGVADACAYPGFSDDPIDGYRGLLSDLERFGADFLSGDGHILKQAAKTESVRTEQENREAMIAYVGDKSKRLEARDQFKIKNYPRVVELLESLQYPDDLSTAERKMFELAKESRI